jgi:hypothetical protein
MQHHHLNYVKALTVAVIQVAQRVFAGQMLKQQPRRVPEPEEGLTTGGLKEAPVRSYLQRLCRNAGTQDNQDKPGFQASHGCTHSSKLSVECIPEMLTLTLP